MNMTVSVPNFFVIGCMVTIWAFFWRWFSARYSETTLGKAMGYIL